MIRFRSMRRDGRRAGEEGLVNRWIGAGAVAAGGLVGVGAVAVAVGALSWRRATEHAFARLAAAQAGGGAERVMTGADSRTRTTELPAPVARYFAFAVPAGKPPIRSARIRWTGEFQSRPGGGWSPFTANQRFTSSPPGFVWDASIRMIPLLPVRVRDSYVAGEGRMLGRVGGVLPVVEEGGTAEVAAGALTRWLGEAVWFPTALLPGGSVRWEAVDDSTARATVTDRGKSVSAEFHFAASGEIAAMTAMRYRDVGGKGVLTPFEGRYGAYGRRDGVMIPLSAEVAWLLPEGRFPYWRGQPAEVEYGHGSPCQVLAR